MERKMSEDERGEATEQELIAEEVEGYDDGDAIIVREQQQLVEQREENMQPEKKERIEIKFSQK